MDQQSNQGHPDQAFNELIEAGRLTRTARMLDPKGKLQANQRTDIKERFRRFTAERNVSQAEVAREVGIAASIISEVIRGTYNGPADKHLTALHNWMELAACRDNLVRKKDFVETSVATEIIEVAKLVAETCKMGVIFGPGQIGKTMTLKAIEGNQRFGDPVLIEVDESRLNPFPLTRYLCTRFDLKVNGTFDVVFARLVGRLSGTKRMLIFDEAELLPYKSLELIRRLHDQTGCPVLFAGKPQIYEKLGFRTMGDFSERLDQLVGRIVIKRDLTERTRGHEPQPLFSLEDIKKLISKAELSLHVAPDATRWLQSKAGSLGTGGIGMAMICLFLAYKLAYVRGDSEITREHLEEVDVLTMGSEDAARIAECVRESTGAMRRVV